MTLAVERDVKQQINLVNSVVKDGDMKEFKFRAAASGICRRGVEVNYFN